MIPAQNLWYIIALAIGIELGWIISSAALAYIHTLARNEPLKTLSRRCLGTDFSVLCFALIVIALTDLSATTAQTLGFTLIAINIKICAVVVFAFLMRLEIRSNERIEAFETTKTA